MFLDVSEGCRSLVLTSVTVSKYYALDRLGWLWVHGVDLSLCKQCLLDRLGCCWCWVHGVDLSL